MGTTPAAIRAAIAARVDDLNGSTLTGESQEPYAFIRSSTHSPVHGEWAIDVGELAPSVTAGRQKIADGQHATLDIRIGMWWQLSHTDRVTDYDALLTAEATVRNYLLARGWHSTFTITWERTPPSEAGLDGWLFSSQTFRIDFPLSLS